MMSLLCTTVSLLLGTILHAYKCLGDKWLKSRALWESKEGNPLTGRTRAVVNETDVVIKVWKAFRLIYRHIQEIPAADDCASLHPPSHLRRVKPSHNRATGLAFLAALSSESYLKFDQSPLRARLTSLPSVSSRQVTLRCKKNPNKNIPSIKIFKTEKCNFKDIKKCSWTKLFFTQVITR